MKLRARADILLENKRYKAGEIIEADEATGLLLLKLAWAEEVVEAKRVIKKKK